MDGFSHQLSKFAVMADSGAIACVLYFHRFLFFVLQKKAKDFGRQKSAEKIDAGAYIAASNGPSTKKKSKHS